MILKTRKKSSGRLLKRIKELGFTDTLGDELISAGIMMKPEEYLIMWVVLAVGLPIIIALFLGNILFAFLAMLIGGIAPLLFIRSKRSKKLKLFDTQLADALMLMSNSLHAGLSFQNAMENIGKEMPDPIAGEFSRVVKEMRYGKTTEQAITDMVERIESRDLMLAMNAVLIQHQVGGNLSEILESIAATIRDRIKIKADIKSLTAQGRMSGMIIGGLPIVVGLMIAIMNPSYMSMFVTEPLGWVLLAVCAVMEFIGFMFIKKIVTIEY